ncbi:structure-specific endonuclease subunit SLX4 [Battus philenor]|uniref:structure-specific endonuclease subunit SLX4 n=1 Tax=Battus philenor TaxID=42288 RepID=UPI0035CF8A9A
MGMEESLTDFEDKKTSCTGPRANQKAKVKKPKLKKHIKGQKDIRTLIRNQKDNLEAYTKDFNNVCLKTGIDVDSEQLQLAIALSKSLQPSDNREVENLETNESLTSQERIKRIRRTLQEYGFKVSATKHKSITNKRVKQYRKHHKLLFTSEEERNQKITDRYSQILLQNPCIIVEKDNFDFKIKTNRLYYLATNASYQFIKSDEVFYVKEIFQEIPNYKANLLKNWSSIPGRPPSPTVTEDFTFSLSDIQCSQVELDKMLSGTLKVMKDICKMKAIDNSSSNRDFQEEKFCNATKKDRYLESGDSNSVLRNVSNKNNILTGNVENKHLNASQDNQTTMDSIPQQIRSQSPDIFDEESSIVDNSINIDCGKSCSFLESAVYIAPILDLPKNTRISINGNLNSISSQVPQNETKRRTNDFMDLTECVSAHSQKQVNTLKNLDKVDLTNDHMDVTECVNNDCKGSNVQAIDNATTNLPVNIENVPTFDLTQSSISDDDLPAIEISGTQKSISDHTIVVNYNDYNESVSAPIIVDNITNKICTPIILNEINLKDDVNKGKSVTLLEENGKESPESLIDQTIILDCNTTPNCITAGNDINILQNFDIESIENVSPGIDLTQVSDSESEMFNQKYDNVIMSENTLSNNYDSLGKKDNVSIDYDDISPDTAINTYQSIDDQFDDIQSKYANNYEVSKTSRQNSKSEIDLNCSNTDCFELSDKEFNYSISKSEVRDLDLGEILVDNNFTHFENTNDIASENHQTAASVNHNEAYITLNQSTYSTPIRAFIKDNKISVQTPTHSEYVIKTGNVTPMLDYTNMSSPERNKELEKYGLKPFKRKRAIQLLTHLYNQTHPIVESCSSDHIITKKFKPNSYRIPLTENVSPRKARDVIIKDVDLKNNTYKDIREVPDIKHLECKSDDWVFPKKEKAKVHTCRLPLHIAFYNYVTCRRDLHNAILKYEPINIDVIHKDLISYGHRYNPKDLLKFMDKKCITVKTVDNNGRNGNK